MNSNPYESGGLNGAEWLEATGPIVTKSVDADLERIAFLHKNPLHCLIEHHRANWEGQAAGGLYIAHDKSMPAIFGTVVIPPAHPHYKDDLPKGAVVLFERYAGEKVVIRGKDFYVINAEAIAARVPSMEAAA